MHRSFEGRLIIANDPLFFAQVCYQLINTYAYTSISIFEINTEDKLLILITIIIWPKDMQYNRHLPCHCIFGIGNKIIIMKYLIDIIMTFDVSTNEQEEIGYNEDNFLWCNGPFYPFKCTLVSP